MRRYVVRIIAAFAVLCLIGPLLQGASRPALAAGFLRPGQLAPSFSLVSLHHQTVTLKRLLGKKPIIINAFASWCPPCQQETPAFVTQAKRYRHAITFIGVDLTSIDSAADARAFTRKYHIPYPVLLDAKGTFRQAYTVIAEPMTFVLTRQGRVVMVYMGALTPAWMSALIHAALAGKPPHM